MIKSLLERIQTDLIFDTVSEPVQNRGNSFVLVNHVLKSLSDARPVILRRGDFYSHAALVIEDWLIDVASLTWAYNLRTNELINTIGSVQVFNDEFSPLMPIHFRWHINSHIVDDVTLDNASFGDKLFKRALEHPIHRPHKFRMLRYKDGCLHALDGFDYLIYDGNDIHNIRLNETNTDDVFELFTIPKAEREQIIKRLHYMRNTYGL